MMVTGFSRFIFFFLQSCWSIDCGGSGDSDFNVCYVIILYFSGLRMAFSFEIGFSICFLFMTRSLSDCRPTTISRHAFLLSTFLRDLPSGEHEVDIRATPGTLMAWLRVTRL
jgi:hypothetical protein